MKKTIYLLAILSVIACKKESKELYIKLIDQKGYGSFKPGNSIVFPSQDSIFYSGVPNEIDEFVVRKLIADKNQKLYNDYKSGLIDKNDFIELVRDRKIDTLDLTDKEIDNEILILIGTNRKSGKVIIVDSDNDDNFENEKVLEYPYPLTINQQDSIQPLLEDVIVNYDVFLKDKIVEKSIVIKPSPYRGGLGISLSAKNPIEQNYFLFASIPQHKKGKALINNKEYTIEISNGFTTPIYNSNNARIFIYGERQNDILERNNFMTYNIGDVFNADGKDYTIKKISKLGNQLTLEYLKDNDKPKGNIVGYYPLDFEAKTIDNTNLKLETYKGSYVLIDFWGTWCAPCIKALPELKEVNNQLSKSYDFKLISVAFDSNIEEVKSFTKKHEMNWEHVFVDNTQYNDNSIVAKFDINSFPSTILIDPSGKIVSRNETFEAIKKIVRENNAL